MSRTLICTVRLATPSILAKALFFSAIVGSSLMFAVVARADDDSEESGSISLDDDRGGRWRLPWHRRSRGTVRVVGNPAEFEGAVDPENFPLSPAQLRAVGLRTRPAGTVELDRWPDEPATPDDLDAARFAKSFQQLCPPWTEPGHASWLARIILREATAFSVDPLLLGALVYHQSMCDALAEDSYGTGATMISLHMHKRHFTSDGYEFVVPSRSGTQRQTVPLIAWPFNRANLLLAEANLYFAAGLLKVFEEQCPHIDAHGGSSRHRHFVSHFVWGDTVRDTSAEEGILEARRRLLHYYLKPQLVPQTSFKGVPMVSPLDGVPRIITGVWGDDRDLGHRRHAGIDFASVWGEPIRAVAAGVVETAGADMRRDRFVSLDPVRASTIPPERLGPRGLFVRIDHGSGVGSLYAHLSTYVVRRGERVEAGDLLGYVGRTGIHTSDAHLHFGLFFEGRPVDPLETFSTYGFWPGRDSGTKSSRAHRKRRSKSGSRKRSHSDEDQTTATHTSRTGLTGMLSR